MSTPDFFEKRAPNLGEECDRAAAEGAAAGQALGPYRGGKANPSTSSTSSASSVSPASQLVNCLCCGRLGKLESPPGKISILHVCEDCTKDMGPEACELLKMACEAGIAYGARAQYQQDFQTLAGAERRVAATQANEGRVVECAREEIRKAFRECDWWKKGAYGWMGIAFLLLAAAILGWGLWIAE